jgi:hypothetical protein
LKLTDRVYERLPPLERLRAIVSAKARGDKTERDRLVDTCERKAYRMLDWDVRGRADHLHLLALAHYGDVHKLAFGAMKLLACLVTQELTLSDEEELTQEQQRAWEIHDDASQMLCFIASTVEGYERAFERLCESLGFDVPRGLGLATATTSAAFLPHFEQRIRCASSLRVADQPMRRARASGSISRQAPQPQTTRTRH